MVRILMVTPMPPQAQAPGAIPLVLHAQLTALSPRHQVTLVTVVGADPGEWEAVERLRTAGVEVHGLPLMTSSGRQRWQRRWRLANSWLRGGYPWRTLWFWEPQMQHHLDQLLAGQRFDLVTVDDNAMGIYCYRTALPLLFTEHEVRRPRQINWGKSASTGWLNWRRNMARP